MAEAPASHGPLSGVRVLDLAGEAGVFAGRMLAELGADVIRIEPPDPASGASGGGDAVRHRPPFLDGAAPGDPDASLHHLHFNAGKRGITLDLASHEGRSLLRRLVGVADIWLDTAPPGAMDALGLGYDALRTDRPGLIYTTITPFGQTGPMRDYRGNDLIAVATSGLMFLNGFAEDPPNAPGAEQAYHMASAAAVASALIALAGRERDPERRGRRVDVSLQEATAMSTVQTANANIYAWHGDVPRRTGMTGPYGGQHLHQCRDGKWVSFVIPVGGGPFWGFFVDWLRDEGIESEVADDAFREPAYRVQHGAAVRAAIAELVGRLDRATVFHEGQRRRLLIMPVNDERELLADEQLRSRGYFAAFPHPELGRTIELPGAPYHFSATPAALDRRAPRVGEHTDAVFGELLGIDAAERAALRARGVL